MSSAEHKVKEAIISHSRICSFNKITSLLKQPFETERCEFRFESDSGNCSLNYSCSFSSSLRVLTLRAAWSSCKWVPIDNLEDSDLCKDFDASSQAN